MTRSRRSASLTARTLLVAAVATSALSGCTLLEATTQSACDALYTQIDGTIVELGGGINITAQELDDFLTELEQHDPESFAQVRDGNFSALLESHLDVPALEQATGNDRLSEFLTPKNLAALDGVGGTLMGTIDQIRTVCS